MGTSDMGAPGLGGRTGLVPIVTPVSKRILGGACLRRNHCTFFREAAGVSHTRMAPDPR